jgi:cobalt-zinc-cadmium efflux system protein
LQHEGLRSLFVDRRRAAGALAERVNRHLREESPRQIIKRWLPLLLAAAAGFLVAVVLFQPWRRTREIIISPQTAEIRTTDNALSLIVVAFFIFYEAFQRLRNPEHVHAGTMMGVAAAGVIMNGVIAAMLWRSGRDVNVRSAFIHEIGDTLSTAAVIVGGWAILLTNQYWIDSALSFGIGALILWSSFGIVRETMNILLEGTPRGMDVNAVELAMRSVGGVSDVHDLHVWCLGSENCALSAHVKIADITTSESDTILRAINDCLGHEFEIHHTTIQFEHEACETPHGCVGVVAEPHDHSHK